MRAPCHPSVITTAPSLAPRSLFRSLLFPVPARRFPCSVPCYDLAEYDTQPVEHAMESASNATPRPRKNFTFPVIFPVLHAEQGTSVAVPPVDAACPRRCPARGSRLTAAPTTRLVQHRKPR